MKGNPAAAFLVLRLGLAFVFIWFGISQLANPADWTSFLPEWAASLPFSAEAFVQMNAWFEIVFAALLVLGLWTRLAALLLGLHLVGIALAIGYNSVAIRDIGLAAACFALALGGAGRFAIDARHARVAE